MTTLRDMFAGHTVQLAFSDGHWTVSLVRPSGRSAWDLDCDTLDEALSAARTFAGWLVDDTEIPEERMREYQRDVLLLLEEAKRRHEAGEDIGYERDSGLRVWFTREMDDG
jgi:hypothetical protein